MLQYKKVSHKVKLRSIAVLTSGGDAPGMNAAIRAVVRYGISQGCEVSGIIKGYRGILEGQIFPLALSSVANILQRGGTLLKTDRCLDFHRKAYRARVAKMLRNKGIEGLVVIGGDGSFKGAYALEKETGFPTIGVPGTIDNDIAGSEDSIGFDTAVNTAIQAIDRIRDTASSHDRTFLVEVMGRSTGFIALQTGIGGGAETILVPGTTVTANAICKTIERGIKRGKTSSIIVVAEGSRPGFSQRIAHSLSKRGFLSRVCILGHTQRGGAPTAHDRLLASALGASAVSYLIGGQSGAMVGVQNNQVVWVPYRKIIGKNITGQNITGKIKPISNDLFYLAKILAT
jgi:6-phosphofructokinase 1